MDDGYFETRFAPSRDREKVWKVLAGEFQRWIDPRWAVIELGAGYCDLINNLRAQERHAVDVWPGFASYAGHAVKTHVASVCDMPDIPDCSFDAAVASNLLEHLERSELVRASNEIRRILKPAGRLVILQPNYRYAFREYFDDYTHKTVFSHVSLKDFLEANGWRVEKVFPRFLPLTMKTRTPKYPILVKLYLWSPVKPFAKQMLVVALKQ